MNRLTYYITFFFLIVAIQSKAIQIHSTTLSPEFYDKLGEDISRKVGEKWNNEINSFLEVVSGKIVDKLEHHVTTDGVADKMLVLLENNAEIFDAHHYKNNNIALIQTLFFGKIKEKFLSSKFGSKIKELGKKAKEKLVKVYHEHKDKLKHFFSILIKAFVLPLAIKFIRTHLSSWKKHTIEATSKLEENARKILIPVISKMFVIFQHKVDHLADKYQISTDAEEKMLTDLVRDEKDIEKLEKKENSILSH